MQEKLLYTFKKPQEPPSNELTKTDCAYCFQEAYNLEVIEPKLKGVGRKQRREEKLSCLNC